MYTIGHAKSIEENEVKIMKENNINEKLCLTIAEAVIYSGLGRTTIEAMLNEPDCDFVVKVGNRKYIKRQLFEQYINNSVELKTK